MEITKRALRDALATNDAGLAKFFNVTPSAVSQWADDELLPRARQWQVKALRPDLVQEEASLKTRISAEVDSRMSKRALRAKFGFKTDAPLAKLLKLPVEQVEAWPEEQSVPALPQVMRLLGVQETPPAAEAAPTDPDADRIINVEAA